jgi:hypothetical protein
MFLDAWQHRLATLPSHVRFYRCRTPSLPCDGTGGAVGPGLRPILALAGRLARHSTAPTLQFLYSGQARSGTFAFRRGSRVVKALPASRRTRLVVHSGAQVSPLVSDASGWAGPPWSAGATRVNQTDHDGGRRGRQCPGAGGPDGILGSSRPSCPGDGGGCPATPGGTSVQFERLSLSHAPQATNVWLRRELSLSADRASTVKSTSSAGKSRETRILPTEPLGIGPIGLRL